jgi:uncharacterized protein YjiS (DUF1127 family)
MTPFDQDLHLGARHGTWPVELDGRFGRASPGLLARLRFWLARTVETLELWGRRRRQRDALLSLDDSLLKDIGLTRLDAEAEWRKPFWRA